MGSEEYDLVVIGAGPGGYVAAIRGAQLGLKVACVEKEPALGGTCLRIGCIPSKALLESSEKLEEAGKSFASHGINLSGVGLDLAAMLRRKDQVVMALTKGVEALFKKNHVTRYAGSGRIDGPGTVIVDASSGPTQLKAKWILIATGSVPATVPGVTPDGDRVGTSTEALSFPEVPRHLVVIGGGYIGLELGTVWRRLGSRVTVLEFLDRILFGMDSEIASEALKIFRKQGFDFQFGTKVTGVKVKGDECMVLAEGREPIVCDRVLVAVGRVPNTAGLGLESVGIRLHPKGQIPVNEHFATTAEGIYAIGDVITGPMLAHKAEEEGIACVERLVMGHAHVNYDAIPAVVYTQPQIGSVGKTEEQLREADIEYKKGVFPFRANGRARSIGHTDGLVKVLAYAATDRIAGVQIIGPEAGDLINEAATAMNFGATSEDLARTCHAHPTLGEALKEAALAVANRAIHF
jgi:dihydrolipoamide dehydrogenase